MLPARDGRSGSRVVRALGVDPGLVETGYGALEAGSGRVTVLGAGVIRTRTSDPLDARLERLFDETHRLLQEYRPDLVVVEEVFSVVKVPRTAILMGHARGVICLAARQQKVPLLPITPAEVKRALTASGAAGKGQMERAVQARLGLPRLPRPSHVADALGLALTGLSRVGARPWP